MSQHRRAQEEAYYGICKVMALTNWRANGFLVRTRAWRGALLVRQGYARRCG